MVVHPLQSSWTQNLDKDVQGGDGRRNYGLYCQIRCCLAGLLSSRVGAGILAYISHRSPQELPLAYF